MIDQLVVQFRRWLLVAGILGLLPMASFAQSVCPRPAASSAIGQPTDLFSSGGVLNVNFKYNTTTDAAGRTLFCFTTLDGVQSPTLHVKPGDTINISVQNLVPPPPRNRAHV